jgi:hypothetical protein
MEAVLFLVDLIAMFIMVRWSVKNDKRAGDDFISTLRAQSSPGQDRTARQD